MEHPYRSKPFHERPAADNSQARDRDGKRAIISQDATIADILTSLFGVKRRQGQQGRWLELRA